jgi:hypothetical protein
MFVVKRLGKNGMWSAVSLIDHNGSFRGEAKFETREEAVEYMDEYLKRMKSRQRVSPEGYGDVKVFDERKRDEANEEKKPLGKAKKKAH